ncbi:MULTISPECIES: VOC family protein [Bacillus]|uniref:Lysine/ornithine N-monooxygenase n=2 Tax=Bacillus infantis TaxID=324767 RepID=U5L9T4_9BACI|nr:MULTISPECIES: glyoxalase/bleomycin resistance/dioxygenase family protein [Bacillus]OXT18090.1 glyoxalase/bleomycin resistance/dioxygenase family protein [Bacillus sp. OG2]AGX04604.1 lysine/ornithine N-monooxygenase [Bacillus infantis NRRL B-14911]EAR68328.1 hypothetical protein B14911_26755 [Bacillus sp. NRRL B-14911]MCK6205513.1 glyoxalase/bleomycin resistance/dioxygenase family protein [Bacillus infantis]RYI29625.1 glyoxalase/bleomycin resistance/dioxygenase family protein [Bacillus infan
MYIEMTTQLRVADFKRGEAWYTILLKRAPDFIPHKGFAEWELVPGSWLQLASGNTAEGSGPIRLGVKNIEAERQRLMDELMIEPFLIQSRSGVPVKWGTFTDPWGNLLGLFEYMDKSEEKKRIREIWGHTV